MAPIVGAQSATESVDFNMDSSADISSTNTFFAVLPDLADGHQEEEEEDEDDDDDDDDDDDEDVDDKGGDDQVFQRLWSDPKLRAEEGRVVYLSRHGESEFNLYGKIGGNSPLSVQGEKYAAALANYFNSLALPDLQVWTSELFRTQQTVQEIDAEKLIRPQLNEVNAGMHDGLTYEEIAERYPVEFARRDQDKLRYRYPGGESYLDVCRRLTEILPLLSKSSNNLLVVSHQAVIRCIVTYLTQRSLQDLPYIKIPLHTIIKVTLVNGRNQLEFIRMSIDCVDTYRAKPTNCSTDRTIHDALVSIPFHL